MRVPIRAENKIPTKFNDMALPEDEMKIQLIVKVTQHNSTKFYECKSVTITFTKMVMKLLVCLHTTY